MDPPESPPARAGGPGAGGRQPPGNTPVCGVAGVSGFSIFRIDPLSSECKVQPSNPLSSEFKV